MSEQNHPSNTVTLCDAINTGTRRARALARVLQTAATSSTGVENEELVEVADIIVCEMDKVISVQEGVYQALRHNGTKKARKRRQ